MEPTDHQPRPPPTEPPPLPVWPVRPTRPELHTAVTVLCAVVVALAALLLAWAALFGSHLGYLEDPETTVIAIGERDLDLDAALQTAPGWEQMLYRLLAYTPERTHRLVGDAYLRVMDFRPYDTEALAARLVVLEAEMGNEERMDDAVNLLPNSPETDRFLDAVLYAYYGEEPRRPLAESGPELHLLTTGGERIAQTEWSRDRVRERLAERNQDPEAAERWREATLARGRPPLQRGSIVEAIYVLTLLAGMLIVLGQVSRWRESMAVADGMVVAPWSLRYGSDIILRCTAASLLVSMFAWWGPWKYWATFICALPMLVIMHRYLFRPDGSNLWKGFGMWPGTFSWKGMILFALALSAVDQAGCLVIRNVAELIGLPVVWEEGLDETLLFGSLPVALLFAIDGVIWAPLFEEIAFRGLLYVTLRTRMTAVPAAAISAGLFGAVHLYSIAGFLEVTWTGFILAVGYERCRSLWPCIFAHCFNNLFFFGLLMLVYR